MIKKFILIVLLSLFIPTFVYAGEEEAESIRIENKTPFHFLGSQIVNFFFVYSRDDFFISPDSEIKRVLNDAMFEPAFLLSTQNQSKELCFFSGIDGEFQITITYNGCDQKNPHCVIYCNSNMGRDEVTVNYADLVTFFNN